MPAAVLCLNADYRPLRVIPWQRAVVLLLEGTARRVENYSDALIRSASLTLEWPAVIALKTYVQPKGKVKLSRHNVLARDAYKCQYCGAQPRKRNGSPLLEELTVDHVVPRAQSTHARVTLPGGKVVPVTSWPNLVTACVKCNSTKGAKRPDEAGMPLKRWPQPPTQLDVVRMSLYQTHIPSEWKEYLPPGCEAWADYWDGELGD